MSLFQTIKAKHLDARKSRNAALSSLLSTLLGEAAMPGKNDGNRESLDEEVQAVIRKFIKNIESLPVEAKTAESAYEHQVLCDFLPKQLTEAELRIIVGVYVTLGAANMGAVMKQLKAEHEGTYNGALASKLIKELMI
jgi:uncharacterized protein YqeY